MTTLQDHQKIIFYSYENSSIPQQQLIFDPYLKVTNIIEVNHYLFCPIPKNNTILVYNILDTEIDKQVHCRITKEDLGLDTFEPRTLHYIPYK
jgi:hypothetical protein